MLGLIPPPTSAGTEKGAGPLTLDLSALRTCLSRPEVPAGWVFLALLTVALAIHSFAGRGSGSGFIPWINTRIPQHNSARAS